MSYFSFIAAIPPLQVTMLVTYMLYTHYDFVIRVMYVVIFNITDDIGVVFATLNSAIY